MHALQTFYLLTVKNDSESDGLVGNIVASRFVTNCSVTGKLSLLYPRYLPPAGFDAVI